MPGCYQHPHPVLSFLSPSVCFDVLCFVICCMYAWFQGLMVFTQQEIFTIELFFSILFFFSQLPHFINSSLPAHDRMTALQIDSYFRQELIYKRNERMARRVSALLQRNPNQTYFFAFGAGKEVSLTLREMCRVKYKFSFLHLDTL